MSTCNILRPVLVGTIIPVMGVLFISSSMIMKLILKKALQKVESTLAYDRLGNGIRKPHQFPTKPVVRGLAAEPRRRGQVEGEKTIG